MLYVACQTRDGDLDRFFSHENSAAPPLLSQGGMLRAGNKAALMSCLETEDTTTRNASEVDAKVLDGPAVVQMLHPGTARTFQDYAEHVFAPHIASQLQNSRRINIVWDVYMPESLKASTRQRRGRGTRRRVLPSATLPKNWKEFLRVNGNKKEVFFFLSEQIITLAAVDGKEVYATQEENVLCSVTGSDLTGLAPGSHEEADTRIFVHVADTISKGCKKVFIRTVDTDVIAIAVAAVNVINPDELWVAYGNGPNLRYIAVHEISPTMDPRKSAVLPIFHAFTGCDTVSAFGGRGEKTAWDTWNVYPQVTEAFEELTKMHGNLTEKAQSQIERFVILMYDRASDVLEINKARKELFTKKSRSLENVPPTQAALKEHRKRASLQGQSWIKATELDWSAITKFR